MTLNLVRRIWLWQQQQQQQQQEEWIYFDGLSNKHYRYQLVGLLHLHLPRHLMLCKYSSTKRYQSINHVMSCPVMLDGPLVNVNEYENVEILREG
jgi:hypothetical protein